MYFSVIREHPEEFYLVQVQGNRMGCQDLLRKTKLVVDEQIAEPEYESFL